MRNVVRFSPEARYRFSSSAVSVFISLRECPRGLVIDNVTPWNYTIYDEAAALNPERRNYETKWCLKLDNEYFAQCVTTIHDPRSTMQTTRDPAPAPIIRASLTTSKGIDWHVLPVPFFVRANKWRGRISPLENYRSLLAVSYSPSGYCSGKLGSTMERSQEEGCHREQKIYEPCRRIIVDVVNFTVCILRYHYSSYGR